MRYYYLWIFKYLSKTCYDNFIKVTLKRLSERLKSLYAPSQSFLMRLWKKSSNLALHCISY